MIPRRANPLSASIPAGWSVTVNDNPKTNPMVSGPEGKGSLQLWPEANFLQKSLHLVHGQAKGTYAGTPRRMIGFASDNGHFNLDAESVDSIIDIMSSSAEDGSPTGNNSATSCDGSAAITSGTSHPANVKSNPPLSRPNPGTLQILDGNLLPTSMADRFLQRVWARLDAAEQAESDVHLRDDIRISKLCVLNVELGQADPWRFAFWTYLGITPEKWQGIRAEREAYERTLGPTLAEQLEDPNFLQSLDAEIRASLLAARPQARLPFSPESAPSKRKKRIA